MTTPTGEGLDDFLKKAEHNVLAWSETFPKYRARLEGIHNGYGLLLEGLHNTQDWVIVMFVLRANSAFLASCRLALSGQPVESYVTSRACLEASLYGVYLHGHPDDFPVWRDRHDDEASLKACRDTFKIRTMLEFLIEIDRKAGKRIEQLYIRTIDFGAHPNEKALFSTMRKTVSDDMVDIRMHYLIAEVPIIEDALQCTAQSGLCALDAFRNVFPKRFALIGLEDRIRELRKGL